LHQNQLIYFQNIVFTGLQALLTDNVAQTVMCSNVASRLDYCNALLSGTPAVALFLLLLHPPGILYLLTFDSLKIFSLSNAT